MFTVLRSDIVSFALRHVTNRQLSRVISHCNMSSDCVSSAADSSTSANNENNLDGMDTSKASAVSEKSKNMTKRDKRRKNAYQQRQKFMIEKKRQKMEAARDNHQQNIPDLVDSLSDDLINETEYYVENGLRKVYPYYFTYNTHAKGRWVGRTLRDVFTTEFYAHSAAQFENAIARECITLNGKPADAGHVLKNNDLVTSKRHRHELPVIHQPIEIIEDTPELLVVNKPSSLPIHPCGRYRYNTLIYILAKEHGYRTLRTTYRLDRLTSGLIIFTKTWLRAKQITAQIAARNVSKEYVCKVAGRFPNNEVCSEPIGALSHRMGVYRADPNGKEANTTFELLHYNASSDTSVVLCKPKTGRTHQIRIHLQFLGYPIVNDPIYNTSLWGPSKGKDGDYGDQSIEEMIEKLPQYHNKEEYLITNNSESSISNKTATGDVKQPTENCDVKQSADKEDEVLPPEKSDVSQPSEKGDIRLSAESDSSNSRCAAATFDSAKLIRDSQCDECSKMYRDPTLSELTMYLHAWSYQGPDWSYRTSIPDWAIAEEQ